MRLEILFLEKKFLEKMVDISMLVVCPVTIHDGWLLGHLLQTKKLLHVHLVGLKNKKILGK